MAGTRSSDIAARAAAFDSELFGAAIDQAARNA
jgi:hypothetical protein